MIVVGVQRKEDETMIFYIVRHGETEWNRVKRMQGQTDIPLSEEGVRLAKQSGERMKDLPIDLIISSPLSRAVETARLMTEGRDIPLLTDARIQEISFGEWEGERIFESSVVSGDFRTIFYEDPMHCETPPAGESFADVLARTQSLFQELIREPDYQDKHILISSHGAAGRCFLANFYEDRNDIWRGSIPKNCAVTIAEYTDGHARVIELDHLYYED